MLYLVTRWQIWATSPASWRFRNRWSIGEKRDRLKASVSTPLSLNQFIYHLNRTNYGIVSSLTRYCHLGAPLSLVMELLMATVSWFQVSSPHTKLNDLFTHSTVINTLTWIEFKKQNTNKQKTYRYLRPAANISYLYLKLSVASKGKCFSMAKTRCLLNLVTILTYIVWNFTQPHVLTLKYNNIM